MIDGRKNGEILREMMNRAGYSVRDFATAAGYAHGSGVQRYIEPDFDEPISPRVAEKLARALEGRGKPPIGKSEVFALTGLSGLVEAVPNEELAPRYMDLPRDIPVYGTAIGTFSEDERIEQTVIEFGQEADHWIRPPGVARRKGVYGLYVAGESQSPRWRPGDALFVDPNRTPMIGDDVVVYLKGPEGDQERVNAVLLKELVRRNSSVIELHQLNPDANFVIDPRKVLAMHRVLTNIDLYGGYR